MSWEIAGKGTSSTPSKLLRKKMRGDHQNNPISLRIRRVARDTGEKDRSRREIVRPVDSDQTLVVHNRLGSHLAGLRPPRSHGLTQKS
jgi:hypothetical protein